MESFPSDEIITCRLMWEQQPWNHACTLMKASRCLVGIAHVTPIWNIRHCAYIANICALHVSLHLALVLHADYAVHSSAKNSTEAWLGRHGLVCAAPRKLLDLQVVGQAHERHHHVLTDFHLQRGTFVTRASSDCIRPSPGWPNDA
jgi:hypothetical protein